MSINDIVIKSIINISFLYFSNLILFIYCGHGKKIRPLIIYNIVSKRNKRLYFNFNNTIFKNIYY